MSSPEQDGVTGQTPPQTSRRPTIWVIALAAIVVSAALAAAFILGRTTSPPPPNAMVQTPAAGSGASTTGQEAVTGNPPPTTAGQSAPQAAPPVAAPNANLLITDRLLAHPPTYEEHQSAATTTSVCLGETLRIANLTSRRLGLIDTPDESDASSTLGSVEPGAVFNMVAEEAGTFFISAAGHDGLLFRYVARRCTQK